MIETFGHIGLGEIRKGRREGGPVHISSTGLILIFFLRILGKPGSEQVWQQFHQQWSNTDPPSAAHGKPSYARGAPPPQKRGFTTSLRSSSHVLQDWALGPGCGCHSSNIALLLTLGSNKNVQTMLAGILQVLSFAL